VKYDGEGVGDGAFSGGVGGGHDDFPLAKGKSGSSARCQTIEQIIMPVLTKDCGF